MSATPDDVEVSSTKITPLKVQIVTANTSSNSYFNASTSSSTNINKCDAVPPFASVPSSDGITTPQNSTPSQKRIIRSITKLDVKKLKEPGLDLKLIEALNKQKEEEQQQQEEQKQKEKCFASSDIGFASASFAENMNSVWVPTITAKSSAYSTKTTITTPTTATATLTSSSSSSSSSSSPPTILITASGAKTGIAINKLTPPTITITRPTESGAEIQMVQDSLTLPAKQRLAHVKTLLQQKILKKAEMEHVAKKSQSTSTPAETTATTVTIDKQSSANIVTSTTVETVATGKHSNTKKEGSRVLNRKVSKDSLTVPTKATSHATHVKKKVSPAGLSRDLEPANVKQTDIPKASIKPKVQALPPKILNHSLNTSRCAPQKSQKVQQTTFATSTPMPGVKTLKHPVLSHTSFPTSLQEQSKLCAPATTPITKQPVSQVTGKRLEVLECKVLSQDEKIDINALGLQKPILENINQELAIKTLLPTHFNTQQPVPIAAPKQEVASKSHGFESAPKVKQTLKFIRVIDKDKFTPDKIAALAKQIKKDALNKAKHLQKPKQANGDKHSGTRATQTPANLRKNTGIKPGAGFVTSQLSSASNTRKESSGIIKETSEITLTKSVSSETPSSSDNTPNESSKRSTVIPLKQIKIRTSSVTVKNQTPDALVIENPQHNLPDTAYVFKSVSVMDKNIIEQQKCKNILPTIAQTEPKPLKSTGKALKKLAQHLRKSVVEIVKEPASNSTLSAVDFITSLAASNPITEDTTLELSAEELNLNASFALNLSPIHLSTSSALPQRQTNAKKHPIACKVLSDIVTPESNLEIGKIISLEDANIFQVSDTANIKERNSLANSETYKNSDWQEQGVLEESNVELQEETFGVDKEKVDNGIKKLLGNVSEEVTKPQNSLEEGVKKTEIPTAIDSASEVRSPVPSLVENILESIIFPDKDNSFITVEENIVASQTISSLSEGSADKNKDSTRVTSLPLNTPAEESQLTIGFDIPDSQIAREKSTLQNLNKPSANSLTDDVDIAAMSISAQPTSKKDPVGEVSEVHKTGTGTSGINSDITSTKKRISRFKKGVINLVPRKKSQTKVETIDKKTTDKVVECKKDNTLAKEVSKDLLSGTTIIVKSTTAHEKEEEEKNEHLLTKAKEIINESENPKKSSILEENIDTKQTDVISDESAPKEATENKREPSTSQEKSVEIPAIVPDNNLINDLEVVCEGDSKEAQSSEANLKHKNKEESCITQKEQREAEERVSELDVYEKTKSFDVLEDSKKEKDSSHNIDTTGAFEKCQMSCSKSNETPKKQTHETSTDTPVQNNKKSIDQQVINSEGKNPLKTLSKRELAARRRSLGRSLVKAVEAKSVENPKGKTKDNTIKELKPPDKLIQKDSKPTEDGEKHANNTETTHLKTVITEETIQSPVGPSSKVNTVLSTEAETVGVRISSINSDQSSKPAGSTSAPSTLKSVISISSTKGLKVIEETKTKEVVVSSPNLTSAQRPVSPTAALAQSLPTTESAGQTHNKISSATADDSIVDGSREESSSSEELIATHCKRLRKTKPSGSKKPKKSPITDTDSDDEDGDERFGKNVEFCGFDENSPTNKEVHKKIVVLKAVTNKLDKKGNRKSESSARAQPKSTRVNTLTKWLTAEKAHTSISKVNKNAGDKVESTDLVTSRNMPLKKRWELAQQQDDPDITDDTSPIDEEVDRDNKRPKRRSLECSLLSKVASENTCKMKKSIIEKVENCKALSAQVSGDVLEETSSPKPIYTIPTDNVEHLEKTRKRKSEPDLTDKPQSKKYCLAKMAKEIPTSESLETSEKQGRTLKSLCDQDSSFVSRESEVDCEAKSPEVNTQLPNALTCPNIENVDNQKASPYVSNCETNALEKKKRGRKPKALKRKDSVSATSNTSVIAGADLAAINHACSALETSKEIDSTLNDSEVPVVAKKKRGRKPKTLLNADISAVISDDQTNTKALETTTKTESPVTERKKRGRKPKKLSTENSPLISISSTEPVDAIPNSQTTPVIKKKPGRKPKFPSEPNANVNEERPKADFNPRLLLARKREQMDTDEVLTLSGPAAGSGPIQCGLCLARMKNNMWEQHLTEHYGIGWIVGESEICLTSRNVVRNAIILYFKNKNISALSCRMCARQYRSGLGLLLHIEACGAEKIKSACVHCQREFAVSFLPAHQRTCLKSMQLEEELSKVEDTSTTAEDVYSNTGRVKRVSLLKAEKKLKAIREDMVSSTDGYELKKHVKYKPPLQITDGLRKQWQQDLEHKQIAACPHQSCTFTANDVEDLEKHFGTCAHTSKLGYSCLLCKPELNSAFATEKEALKHIMQMHKTIPTTQHFDADDSSDADRYDALSSSEDDASSGVDSNEEEDALASAKKSKGTKGKNEPSSCVQSSSAIGKLFGARAKFYSKIVLKKWADFTKNNYSTERLFKNASASFKIVHLSTTEISKYLPAQEVSMKYSISEKSLLPQTLGIPDQVDWLHLKRFEHVKNKSESLNFIGGPIKKLAWVPLPDHVQEQYLLIAYHKDFDKFTRTMNAHIRSTLLLLYRVTQSADSNTPTLQQHYSLRVREGPVHCFAFLPSGGYDAECNRLGLLAVGTITSTVNVYALPLEVTEKEDEHREKWQIIDAPPQMVLILDMHTKDNLTTHRLTDTQCMHICWSEFSGHRHIYASFSNGFIGIWDINNKLNENLNLFIVDGVRHFAPLNYFYTGENKFNLFALHYDKEGVRWLTAAKATRDLLCYDMRNLAQPVFYKQEDTKNIVRDMCWSPVMEALVFVICDSAAMCGSSLMAYNPNWLPSQRNRIDSGVCAFSAVHYSPLLNMHVCGGDNGDLIFLNTRQLCFEDVLPHCMKNARAVSSMDVKCLNGENIVRHTDKEKQWKMYESKEKYGVIFGPLMKYNPESHKSLFCSNKRVPPMNLLRFMRINTLQFNLNTSGKELIAIGHENGFLRLLKFQKKDFFFEK